MKKQLIQWNLGVNVRKAKNKTDATKIGIHLLNPTQREFDDAQVQADRDMFGAIYIHNNKTWPRKYLK